MAARVTLTCIVVAFPIAFYMARLASPRTRGLLLVSILLPLWSRLPRQGLRLAADPEPERRPQLGSSRRSGSRGPGYSDRGGLARRELPVAAVHDHPDLRRPRADPVLAARGVGRSRRASRDHVPAGRSCRWPCRPSSPASIFTFSLTLGDYITPTLVSNTKFIGNVVYDLVGVAGNQPLAAAYTMVPGHDHARLPARRAPARRVRGALMRLPRGVRDRAPHRDAGDPRRSSTSRSRSSSCTRSTRPKVATLADHSRSRSTGIVQAFSDPGHPGRDRDLAPGRDRGDRSSPWLRFAAGVRGRPPRFFGRQIDRVHRGPAAGAARASSPASP